MALQGVGEFVIVKLLVPETTTPGGVLLPEKSQVLRRGEVLSCGEWADKALVVGAVVHFLHAETTVKHGAEEYYVLKHENIFCLET